MMRQGYCARCHEMIWWGKTKKGKNIPLEDDGWALPDAAGDVMWDETGNQFYGRALKYRIPGAVKMFRPHFLYCPFADQLRKKPKPKTAAQLELESKKEAERQKKAALEAKRAERERIARAQAEFEAQQLRLF